MKLILSLDQGTTGTKATLYALDGKPVAQSYTEFPQVFPKEGWVEHRGEDILASVQYVLRKVLQQKEKGDQVACIGITNQRETVFAWDRETGELLHNGIVWQCRRTAQRCQELKAKEKLIQQKTGLLVDAYFSATKMEWLLKNSKKVERAQSQNRLAFGTVDTFLLFHLTGKKVHATEPSNASRTMLFNIKKGKFDPFLLNLFSIPDKALPEVLPSAGLFGYTKNFPPLPDGIPITGIAGDQQSALFGQGCLKPGSAKNTYGTGAFVLMNTGERVFFSKKGLITTIAWKINGKTTYALEGSIFICGAVIQWLRDNLGILSSAQETEEMIKKTTSSGGVIFVPALAGLGAPYWDPYARGLIIGITRATTREQIVRAAVESMALQVAEVTELMQAETGIRLRALLVDGGASSNAFLLRLQSNLLARKVIQGSQEATSLGAALLAGVGAELFTLSEVEKKTEKRKVFHPKKDPSLLPLRALWREGVARALKWERGEKSI